MPQCSPGRDQGGTVDRLANYRFVVHPNACYACDQ